MTYRSRHIGQLEIIEVIGDPDQKTVLLLHGFGADASDLASLSEINPKLNWIFPHGPLLIPLSPHYTGKAWFPVNLALLTQAVQEHRLDEIAKAFPPELNEARQVLDQLLLDLRIPRSQVIIGGFSQGAILAIETALKGREKMGGLLILSGTLVNEANWKKEALNHAGTPFFQSHGSHDSLLPLKKAEDLATLLKKSGLVGKLNTFNGGHEIPPLTIRHLADFLTHMNN